MAKSSVPHDRIAAGQGPEEGELDFRSVGRAVWRRKKWVFLPAVIAGLVAFAAVNLMTPKYKSESRVILDGRESGFTRPDAERNDRDRATVDQEAISSQVQLAMSREVARQVIRELKLNEVPEFDSTLRGIGPLRHVLILLGISRDPFAMTPEERVFEAYYERLQAFQVEKSRVIAIEFQSSDPDLAARAANAVADAYMTALQGSRREQTKAAGDWLLGEIEKLRQRVSEAEAKVEQFRSRSNLYAGNNNTSLSTQQLAELSTQLATARSQKAEIDARAQAIREMLRSGRPIESGDVVNSELIRRLNEQRVTLRAQLAEQSSTLLDSHPRIKELRAQIGDLERQIRIEAERLVRSLENDARIAASRVEQLTASVEQLKRAASTTNEQDVQLRALEREAKAQRELLESYLAKYRETTSRDSLGAVPGDARVISRAIVSSTPYFPKKLPIILVAIFGTLLLSIGLITTGELLSTGAYGREVEVANYPSAYPAAPVKMSAPTVAPSIAPRAEEPAVVATPVVSAPSVAPVEQSNPYAIPPGLPEVASAPTTSEFTAEGYSLSSMIERFKSSPTGRSRVAVVGLSDAGDATDTAAALARALSTQGRSLWMDASFAKQHAIDSGYSRGIADLVRGEATFGDVITRDRQSRAHFIATGRSDASDVAMLGGERLSIALDALERTYEHLTVDAGSFQDVPDAYLARLAPSIVLVVPETAELDADAAVDRLRDAGCNDVLVVIAPRRMPTADKSESAAAA
ncbi:tyrosine-protein kinase ptk [Variibacter gotjawalensis]|uniref:Tyrosine-protein kinase ptk n=1 Tax=Variibacter gotjawalensis TaxID=1333996 RepID=A0A0S3PX79_9BRAD|nr:exopolysaccharide transport family protein [Variibacter gotjawalensis]NIK46357.1 uncharacterized protein involved in exopolysaccharide biosynthesis/Mrp family chromosome partitioning ATPase [Variibacter gotjawalensis]RZS48267.1 uncharacterized protein involved in exopolysaccharide biosynthesis [Variibacter gotjawalensis]BAT60527.1 tyrosine-protein kinase ptk [Variibacter gotjawalensis]